MLTPLSANNSAIHIVLQNFLRAKLIFVESSAVAPLFRVFAQTICMWQDRRASPLS